jgi:hypothetical protein
MRGEELEGHTTGTHHVALMHDLEQRYPHPERILIAIRLARDVETCERLLQGEPVDTDRIDPQQLRWAKQRFLVRLDMHAIDLLTAA